VGSVLIHRTFYLVCLRPTLGAAGLAGAIPQSMEAAQNSTWQWLAPVLFWGVARALFSQIMLVICPIIRARSPLTAEKQAEVSTRAFYALQHTSLSIVGGLLCWKAGWLTDPGFETFYTFPFPHSLQQSDGSVGFFYQLQVGVHVESAIVLFRNVLRDGSKQQAMMLVHHAVTLFLVGASWLAGTFEVGATMFWLHDASDIGIDLLKLVRAWDAPLPILVAVYLFALVSWGILRCIYLPLHIVIPGWQMFYAMCFDQDPAIHCYGPRGAATYGFPALIGMSTLLVLHVLWFRDLIKSGLRVLRGSSAKATIPDMCAPGVTTSPLDDVRKKKTS